MRGLRSNKNMNSRNMSISAEQCRAARGLLDLSQSKLAEAAHIGPATLSEFERGDRIPAYNNLQAIRAALEAAGGVFIFANGGGAGVRLRHAEVAGETAISPDLCRAARYLSNLSQQELAKAADIGRSTVAEFERGARLPTSGNLTAIQSALEAAGVTFIAADDTAGPGVRLRM